MESVFIMVWFFCASIMLRANVYDIQAEQVKTVFVFQNVDGTFQYSKIEVLNND